MFVKITASGSRQYVQLVESYRDEAGSVKKRTVAYFSDRRRSEQSDRRRRFRLIEDDHGGARVMR